MKTVTMPNSNNNPFSSDLDDDEVTPRKEEADSFDSRMQSNIGKNVHSLESPFDSPVMTSSRIPDQNRTGDASGTWENFDDSPTSSTLKSEAAKTPGPDDTMADVGASWTAFDDDFAAKSETNSPKAVQQIKTESKIDFAKPKAGHAQDLGFCSPQIPLKKPKKRTSTISSTTSEPNMELKADAEEHRIQSPVDRRESTGALKASAVFGTALYDPLQQETYLQKESSEDSDRNLQKSEDLSDDYSLHSPPKGTNKRNLESHPSLARQERISTSSEDFPVQEVPVIVKVVEPVKKDLRSGSLVSTDGSTIDGTEQVRKPNKRQAPQRPSGNTAAAINHAYEESPRQYRAKEGNKTMR